MSQELQTPISRVHDKNQYLNAYSKRTTLWHFIAYNSLFENKLNFTFDQF